ncbi:hypothetical protein [Leisingera sp. ANG59]|uniref:hypothetical protein n=1 Tax=Leisingera sp. ANG59 TaxID=2675221 RepID=UPI001573E639|nr:hypothetical protein [Leisingera sp. ANG59]NSY41195.1 hypothetical protein [Leisingera sp. ANG59]
MVKSLLYRGPRMKQSQKLMLISREASKIRKLHEAGEISAQEASRRLVELRADPEAFLEVTANQVEHTAA